MYLEKITLENIRAIKKLELPPSGEEGLTQHSVIIGRNSTCKSTILRCIAIGLCEEPSVLVSDAGGLIGPADKSARITLNLKQGTEIKTTISRAGKTEKAEREGGENLQSVRPIVCGYGAGRSVSASQGHEEYSLVEAVYTLFQYDVPLMNPELVLLRIKNTNDDLYKQAWELLAQAISLDPERHKIELGMQGITVSGPGIGDKINLGSVADGYRLPFTWLCDFINWVLSSNPGLSAVDEIEGLVLIDELEQHLHPQLQREQLKKLRAQLPNVQIIATTHSPMVTLGCGEEDRVFVLKRDDEEKVVTLEQRVPDMSYYHVEDVYADENLFATETEHPRLIKDRKQYRQLADKPNLDEEEQEFLLKFAEEILSVRKEKHTSPLSRAIEKIIEEAKKADGT